MKFSPGQEVVFKGRHKSVGNFSIPDYIYDTYTGTVIKVKSYAGMYQGEIYYETYFGPNEPKWYVLETMLEFAGGPW